MLRRTVLKASLYGLGWLQLPAVRAADRTLRLASFPDYQVPAVLDQFAAQHGVKVRVETYDSNEELLAACLRGAQFDLLTISHYMVPHFSALGLLRPLPTRTLATLAPQHWLEKFARFGQQDHQWWAAPKAQGNTGFIYRRDRLPVLSTWPEFWQAVAGKASRRATVIDDVQTLIGAALRNFNYSINSTVPAQLLQAEQLLQRSRPHLRALVADVNAAVQRGDWLAMAWSDSGYALTQERDELQYVLPPGSESWCDFYALGSSSAEPELAEALLQWLLQPEHIAQEVIELGVSPVDQRVLALLPAELQQNSIIFPSQTAIAGSEMSSQEALREPLRAEIFARFATSFG